MTSCRAKTATVSWMQKDGPFDWCCNHQSVASPSLCLCQGSRWTFWAYFVLFSWFSVLSKCWNFFFKLGFDCFVYRQNVTCLKRFTRYGLYAGDWGWRHSLITILDIWMWVRGHSRSLKLVPFESLGAVSYSPFIVTLAVSVAVCEIFSAKDWCDLENRVRVRSRSLEMARFDIPCMTFY